MWRKKSKKNLNSKRAACVLVAHKRLWPTERTSFPMANPIIPPTLEEFRRLYLQLNKRQQRRIYLLVRWLRFRQSVKHFWTCITLPGYAVAMWYKSKKRWRKYHLHRGNSRLWMTRIISAWKRSNGVLAGIHAQNHSTRYETNLSMNMKADHEE